MLRRALSGEAQTTPSFVFRRLDADAEHPEHGNASDTSGQCGELRTADTSTGICTLQAQPPAYVEFRSGSRLTPR